VDPFDSKIADPIERNRLARIFEKNLGKSVGFVLRCGGSHAIRRSALDQQPVHCGAEPAPCSRRFAHGYRLPLESLPWTKPEDAEFTFDADPFQTRGQLLSGRHANRAVDTPSIANPALEILKSGRRQKR